MAGGHRHGTMRTDVSITSKPVYCSGEDVALQVFGSEARHFAHAAPEVQTTLVPHGNRHDGRLNSHVEVSRTPDIQP